MAPTTRHSSVRAIKAEAFAEEMEQEKRALSVLKPRADQEVTMKIPTWLKFPLLLLSSLVLSAAGYSALSAVDRGSSEGELAGVSRRLGEWWEVAALITWKAFELGLGWFGEFDSYDISALGLLARGPSLYLLSAFYDISYTTVLSSLAIDFGATYLPFRVLRPLTPTHSSLFKVPNSDIVSDKFIHALTIALPAAIYSVTLFTAYKTFLPRVLALAFDGIRTLEVVYRGDFLSMVPLMVGFGAAVREFVFVPAVVVLPTPQDLLNASFDPATATLSETFMYNIWGFSTRTKTVIKRTAILMFVSGMHTFVQTWVTLEGVEAWGAAVYSGVWVGAAAVAGGVMGLVGAV